MVIINSFQGWRKLWGKFWQNKSRRRVAAVHRITTCPLRFLDLAPWKTIPNLRNWQNGKKINRSKTYNLQLFIYDVYRWSTFWYSKGKQNFRNYNKRVYLFIRNLRVFDWCTLAWMPDLNVKFWTISNQGIPVDSNDVLCLAYYNYN